MTTFPVHTAESAPDASKATLEGVKKAFGFVPNLQANMATSPELLAGYSALWDLFSKTTLTPTEQQVVYLTSNYENECHYCMAGHTKLAQMGKIADPIVQAIRNGTEIPDAKLEALHVFTGLVVRERGFVGDAAVEAFLAAGYTQQNVLEVVLGAGTKLLSNYTNHIVHTQLDPFMKGAEWTKPGSSRVAA
ncbi:MULTISPECIES: carboxymuconolactone decarboxylase family protein [Methylobacterium]|uniref:carboxymuconolactone decarboxylase family protein n=1 Tax=Methylobacterium TaxID=407 RepID=UPI000C4311E3|nr:MULTISPECIES: carboxymuconolactone decarboxylase family protein [Methylobacterium]MBP32783.1 carboxymuconolactone decarboxylase [Methylobacterium sp.]MBX9933198.1 carboxymuconolactone decarboxylase family protein [Methylobacterium sp.]MDH2309119.1 carboxymuconolactone decarboxylase family protein [Methylobacterium brachiatum]RUP22090.1 MAG: carboxymuconolactone decarboxylase family protein [Methylobacterium sp.]WFS05091.1 carboxymuconolactone decarboxylase family protein [Methylobacterium s